MTQWMDYLKGFGLIGMVILIIILFVLMIIAPIVVAILITNILAIALAGYVSISGITWWGVVIVIWIILAALINKLNS